MKRHNYKNLKIWKLGLEIALEVSDIIKTFPYNERYALTSQINRCSVSIPSNIAEGSARTEKTFSHYLDIALGSPFELGTQLLIAHHKNYRSLKIKLPNGKNDDGLSKQTEAIASSLFSLFYFLYSNNYATTKTNQPQYHSRIRVAKTTKFF